MLDTERRDTNGHANGASTPPRPGQGAVVDRVQPSMGVMESARRYPLLVAIPAILLCAAGLALGFQRTPIYTAESRLSVGRINLNAPGALAGFALATQSLAAQYSRTVDADDVLGPIARRRDVEVSALAPRVSGSPIPESPVFTVRGTGPSQRSAVRLSNEVSDSLVLYTQNLNNRDPEAGVMLAAYKKASATLADRETRVQDAARRYEDDPTTSRREALARARASRAFWRLKEDALAVRYQTAEQGATSNSLVQVLNPARVASSDRSRWVQILGFAGLVGGLLLGLGAATLWANRTLRRRVG
ncbi:MAG: hypothetical protein JHC95_17650 [Solirubrobacteraceae bacterium]|nr:hypothetical protein [Solirubrobacteraceae bacterium]